MLLVVFCSENKVKVRHIAVLGSSAGCFANRCVNAALKAPKETAIRTDSNAWLALL